MKSKRIDRSPDRELLIKIEPSMTPGDGQCPHSTAPHARSSMCSQCIGATARAIRPYATGYALVDQAAADRSTRAAASRRRLAAQRRGESISDYELHGGLITDD